jgi:hypothetical protein
LAGFSDKRIRRIHMTLKREDAKKWTSWIDSTSAVIQDQPS